MVVDELLSGAVEAIRQKALGERHADRVAQPLPEWPRGDLDPGRVPALGVARSARAPLAELFEVRELEVVADQVVQRVLEHARVARAEHEAIALRPQRVLRVHAQEALEQRVAQRRQRHRRARMPRVGALDGIHREGANRVDGELAQLSLLHCSRS